MITPTYLSRLRRRLWIALYGAGRYLGVGRALACAILASLMFCAPAEAAPPIAKQAFTNYVAREFRAALPQASFTVTAPLTLEVSAASGRSTASLETLYSSCQRDRADCEYLVKTQVAQMVAYYQASPPAFDRSQLRLIVRPSAYVDAFKRNLAGQGAPIAAPLAGDLWVMVAADSPTTIAMLNERQLPSLKLSRDEAIAIARQNTRSALGDQIKRAHIDRQAAIAGFTDDPYESSLFAFPDLWAPLAQAAGGNLLVSVPATDVVLFADGRTKDAAKALAQAALEVIAQAHRPFSATVYRWRPNGWTEVP